jgi:hypothetical protein
VYLKFNKIFIVNILFVICIDKILEINFDCYIVLYLLITLKIAYSSLNSIRFTYFTSIENLYLSPLFTPSIIDKYSINLQLIPLLIFSNK